MRRRVLTAFEAAERSTEPEEQRCLLTFVVVGGGATGVEVAGAIGQMSRYTLARDFRRIEPSLARVILIEAGPRILPMFSTKLSSRATRDLERLGVQVWTSSPVSSVDDHGVDVGAERISSGAVLWVAGVQASSLGAKLGFEFDRSGHVIAQPDLTVAGHPRIFVAGDQAHFAVPDGSLPGVAPVAMQQGDFLARNILRELNGSERETFSYRDKGKMATIGRSRAITQVGWIELGGFVAWLIWLVVHVVHVYCLKGIQRRFFVVLSWAWSYLTFRRGARLIVDKEWRMNPESSDDAEQTTETTKV